MEEKPTAALSRAPDMLLTNWRRNPVGIAVAPPAFSWSVNLPGDGARQSAFRILVGESEQGLKSGTGLIWDSGKAVSSLSNGIIYSGPELSPARRYFWTVCAWGDGDAPTAFAEPAAFVTAFKDNIAADWIWACDGGSENEHVLLRKAFKAPDKPVASVIAFVSTDDYYKLYINGGFIAQGPAPSFPKEHNCNALDLTGVWRSGADNCVAAHAYYQGLVNWAWVSGDDRRGFIMEIRVTYKDGSRDVFATNPTWKALKCEAYKGADTLGYKTSFVENIDADLLPSGWTESGFDDSAWNAAVVMNAEQWRLHPQETDALVVREEKPVRVVGKAAGHYFFDFGREIVGTLRVEFDATGGEKVIVKLGEELSGPETVRWEMRCNCKYRDEWTLRKGRQRIEHYDYRAFRYGEIVGAPCVLGTDSIVAVVRHYPFDETASDFSCSDDELNSLWALAKYSTLMGTQEVYLDCPTREKAQYTLDTYLEMSAAPYQCAEWNLGCRAVEMFLLSSENGKVSVVAPSSKRHCFTEYLMYPVLMARRYYMHTGDRRFLERNFGELARVEAFLRESFMTGDGVLCGTDKALQDLVDWPRNRRDGHEIMPVNIVPNAVFHRLESDMAEIAAALGKDVESREFAARAERIRTFVNDRLWDATNHRYLDGMDENGKVSGHSSLHANVFPLAMGIVPQARVADAVAFVKTRGLNCNMFLAMFLFEALYDHGAGDYAHETLKARTEDTPMNWVRKGATTTWEAWDLEQKQNTSLFHPAGAFTAYIIASRVMGIQPLEPGFGRMLIRPSVGPLTHGSIKVTTVRGPVCVAFERTPGGYRFTVEIPDNTTARFEFPKGGQEDFVLDDIRSGTRVIEIPGAK